MTSNNSMYFLGAAVVGIVSAAGIFIAEHFRQERRRHVMAKDLARLDQQLSGMRKELEQLRLLQKENFYLQRSKIPTISSNLLDVNTNSELQPHLTYRLFIRNAQRLRKSKRQSNRTLSSHSSASEDYNSALDIDSSDLEFYDLSDEEDTVSTIVPLDQALKELDDKLNSGKLPFIKQAFNRLTDLCLESPQNAELFWRIGKAHHKLATSATDNETKRENITKGIVACEQAVELNNNIAEAHKWLAILVGARIDNQTVKDKINGGFLFKQHLDAAVSINPTDPTLHHLLARFAYETASLKWYERKVAATFFAEPPTATYEEALQYSLDAEKLTKSDWKENKLLVGKCQIALGKYQEAVETLLKADEMPNDECLDATVCSEIKALLQKYNSYR